MTKEDLKKLTINDLPNIFGSKMDGDKLMFYRYPMLVVDLENDHNYNLVSYIVDYRKFEYLIQYPERFSRFIDNVFKKYNTIEIFTDVDDTIIFLGDKKNEGFLMLPDLTKLEKKYNKNVVMHGWGTSIRTESSPFPEDIV